MICTASVQESVRKLDGRPRPRLGDGRVRDAPGVDGRAQAARRHQGARRTGARVEIQRLIGRSLRGVVDFAALGERTIYIDCDVLEADGGTRCASITGGYVALELACRRLVAEGKLKALAAHRHASPPSRAAWSTASPLLDLDYPEDSTAEVDANVVMTGDGGLVEVQATAERTPLSRASLDELLALAQHGIEELRAAQGRRSRRARRARRELAARHAQRPQGARVRRGCCRASRSSRCPDELDAPEETGDHLRRERADQGARRGARDGPRGGRRRLRASRRRRWTARPACAARATPASTPRTGRTSPSCAPRSRRARALRYVCVIARVAPDGAEQLFEGACEGTHGAGRAAATGGFGYDPVFVPGDPSPRPHDGRADRRGEGRDLAPRPGGASAAGDTGRPTAAKPVLAPGRRCVASPSLSGRFATQRGRGATAASDPSPYPAGVDVRRRRRALRTDADSALARRPPRPPDSGPPSHRNPPTRRAEHPARDVKLGLRRRLAAVGRRLPRRLVCTITSTSSGHSRRTASSTSPARRCATRSGCSPGSTMSSSRMRPPRRRGSGRRSGASR